MDELYRTVYGSHLYGTSTPKSDYDYKVVYLPSYRDVLLGRQLKTKNVSTSDDKSKNTEDDVDVQYVPLQTFAKDYFDGQTYAYELAHHFLSSGAKVQNVYFYPFVRELVEKFTTNDMKAMVGYAWSQAEKYALKGKRQKKLESFKDLVNETLKNFQLTADTTTVGLLVNFWNSDVLPTFSPYVKVGVVENRTVNDVRKLLALQILNKSVLYTVKVKELLDRLDDQLSQYGHRVKAAAELGEDKVDWKSLYHAVRIAMQANELLFTGKLTLPFSGDRLATLLKMRNGQMSFEEAKKVFENEINKLDELVSTTMLQPKTEKLREEFEDFLYSRLRLFYSAAVI